MRRATREVRRRVGRLRAAGFLEVLPLVLVQGKVKVSPPGDHATLHTTSDASPELISSAYSYVVLHGTPRSQSAITDLELRITNSCYLLTRNISIISPDINV